MSIRRVVINEWKHAKIGLDKAKRKELSIRNEICPELLGDKLRGSKTEKIGPYKLRVTARLIYTIDWDQFEVLRESLSDEELDCIQWQPKVNGTKYNRLPEDSLLRQCVTTRPGQSSLTLVEDLEDFNDD